MKNYFEHDIKVKIQEGILSKESDWQWLICHIQDNFELNDIDNYSEYEKTDSSLRDVYSYFVTISEITDNDFKFESKVLSDIYLVSKYFNNKKNKKEVQKGIKSSYGKILFLFVYITKIENADNQTGYIFDRRISKIRNFWELIKFDLMNTYSDDIKKLLSEIKIEGFEASRDCILDNLNKVFYPMNLEFIEKYESNFVNVNAFCFQRLKKEGVLTWEEEYLLEMLSINFQGYEIVPLSEFYGVKTPDYTQWTEDILFKMKKYFDGSYPAKFVIETIEYVMYKKAPSGEVILKHFELMNDSIKKEAKINNHNSSFKIICLLFNDKYLDGVICEKEYKTFIKNIQKQENPEVIKFLKEKSLPVSKKQNNILKNFYENQSKEIENVNQYIDFEHYLTNENNARTVNFEYFKKVCQKFYSFIENNTDITTASLFYYFMQFLLKAKSKNTEINKTIISRQMIDLQKIWQNEYFKKVQSSLHEYSSKVDIPNSAVEEFNKIIMKTPYYFAYKCMPVSEEALCKALEITAQYPLKQLCMMVSINEIFPVIKDKNKLVEKHDIDNLLLDTIKEIKKNKGYRLINNLEDESFLFDLHEQWQLDINFNCSLFNKQKELYEEIKKISPIRLLPFDELSVAIIVQLFPVLEIKIRELGELMDIFPFKENDFMKFKDPSGVLKTILTDVHKETNSFNLVNDLFFVYNVMYNSNSFNIRNELIHGNQYIEESNWNFAFKLTLICIFMIQKRIEDIKKRLEAFDS